MPKFVAYLRRYSFACFTTYAYAKQEILAFRSCSVLVCGFGPLVPDAAGDLGREPGGQGGGDPQRPRRLVEELWVYDQL